MRHGSMGVVGDAVFLIVLAAMVIGPIVAIVYLRPRYKRAGKATMTPIEPLVAWLVLSCLVVSSVWNFLGSTPGVLTLGVALLIGALVYRRSASEHA